MEPKPPTALPDLSSSVRCVGCQTLYTLGARRKATSAERAPGCPACGCISWISAAYTLRPSADYGAPRPRPL